MNRASLYLLKKKIKKIMRCKVKGSKIELGAGGPLPSPTLCQYLFLFLLTPAFTCLKRKQIFSWLNKSIVIMGG